jgi:hypothetical protein
MSRSPGDRCQFCDALDWCVCKSWKDVGQVITDRDVEPAAAFNNGEDCRDAWAGVFAADMDPVGPAHGDGTHRIFGEIVAQFEFWMVEEACKSRPDRKRVARSLACGALGQHCLAHRHDVTADLVEQRRSFLLSQSMAAGKIHVPVARLGIDREQLVHKVHRPDRGDILLC